MPSACTHGLCACIPVKTRLCPAHNTARSGLRSGSAHADRRTKKRKKNKNEKKNRLPSNYQRIREDRTRPGNKYSTRFKRSLKHAVSAGLRVITTSRCGNNIIVRGESVAAVSWTRSPARRRTRRRTIVIANLRRRGRIKTSIIQLSFVWRAPPLTRVFVGQIDISARGKRDFYAARARSYRGNRYFDGRHADRRGPRAWCCRNGRRRIGAIDHAHPSPLVPRAL